MKIIAPFATTVAAAALLTAGAVAQTTPPATTPTPPAQTQTTPTTTTTASLTQQSANQWRGSQLIGLNVYNNQNEKVGDVTELITNQNGQVEAVVVGVGGFLGIGRHDVALRWEDLRFVNEPRPAATPTTPAPDKRTTTPNAATPPAAAPAPAARTENREVPDHAVINMTRDQLKAMPVFKYANDKT
jgi:sporulation protein YlmC with PRC-barrel domain